MAVLLSPVGGAAAQFLDNNGNPLLAGKLYTYVAGTTTNQATYTSASGATPHPNPIILDAGGRVPGGEIWLTDGLQYKFVLKNANDVLIGTYDNLVGINSNFINFLTETEVQTATAGQTVFTLTTMQYQPATNNLTVYVDGVNQIDGSTYSYVETSSTVVTFTAGLHVGALVKFTTAQTLSTGVTDASLVTFTGFNAQVGVVQDLAGNDGSNWIGFEAAGTGAVARSAQEKMRDVVSVKDFGAIGNGVADDTNAIRAAIASVTTDFNVGEGATVFFPKAASSYYVITGTIEVPPGIILLGEGTFNANTASGSLILVNFDGVGIRFVRRNPSLSGLFHNGGMQNIAVTGTGGSSTLAQRLVELGDSTSVTNIAGAWNGFIRDCFFNNTRGFGIYSAHSQEWLIDHNFFQECNRSINYSTVAASSKILNNTFINASATACDYAVNYQPGSLGGAAAFVFKNNYIIGFDYGVYVAACKGVVIADNAFENTKEYAIYASTTTFDGTNLGLLEAVLPSLDIHGNTFIAIGAGGNATNVIYFANTRNCNVRGNYVLSPYATLSAILEVYQDASNICVDNNIEAPSWQGNNSGTVPLYNTANTVWGQQYVTAFQKEKVLAANSTTASALGLLSIILQNDAVTTFATLSNGQEGQTVTIHSASAAATVTIDGNSLIIPLYACATYQYSSFYTGWRLVSKSF